MHPSSAIRSSAYAFPWTSSWLKPLCAPSAGSFVSSRASDLRLRLFSLVRFYAPFLLKSEKINSTVQCNFEEIPGASLALTQIEQNGRVK
jgi:hypothetical protein